jgi:hypothetical protein
MVGLQLMLLVAFFFCATNAGLKVSDSRISSSGALLHRHGISPGESLGAEQWLRNQAARRAAVQAGKKKKKKKKKMI